MQYYLYDPDTKRFAGAIDAELQPESSTTVSPFGDQGAPIGTWFDTDKQAWQAPKVEPTSDQKLMMALSQNVTTLQSMVMMQNQQLAQLMIAKEGK